MEGMDESLVRQYNRLFADDPALFTMEEVGYPWGSLKAFPGHAADLRRVAADTALPSRARLLAYRRLQQSGDAIAEKELLGVVIEVGLEQGLDTLAVYADGSTCYINQEIGRASCRERVSDPV